MSVVLKVVSASPDDIHGDEDKRGVTGLDAHVGLIPFQQAEDQEQRVGSVFLQGGARGAEKPLERGGKFALFQIGIHHAAFYAF